MKLTLNSYEEKKTHVVQSIHGIIVKNKINSIMKEGHYGF